ncbi:putative amino acid transporter, transmembrane domain-containing protein [Plasmopara halstedii]
MVLQAQRKAFLTMEDVNAIFTMICSFFGIGTLSMPSNFARAGPVYGTFAMLLMAFANIYATIALSRVMLVAPVSVRTFTDVGDWVFGRPGRYVVIVSQLLVCLLVPCTFLVLGSTILNVLFPDTFSQSFWIVFMAITVIPSCLIPTLKEASLVAFVGCLCTFVAVVVGVGILEWEMRGHPSVPAPNITLHQVLTTFGNLALAYGASIIVPDIQRQHSDPSRMNRIILVSLITGSIFFLIVAIVGYDAGGCQLSMNLLVSIVNISDPTSPSALGFIPHHGAVILAYISMQIHVVIAFSTIIYPSFYMAERVLLGMHKTVSLISSEKEYERKSSTRGQATADLEGDFKLSDLSTPSFTLMAEHQREDYVLQEVSAYRGTSTILRYVTLRLCIIATLVAVSISLRNNFFHLVDFTGASAITICCLALPLCFYLKVFWNELPGYERVIAVAILLICCVVGCYVMIIAGKCLFDPITETATFPYCPVENQMEPYYVRDSSIRL